MAKKKTKKGKVKATQKKVIKKDRKKSVKSSGKKVSGKKKAKKKIAVKKSPERKAKKTQRKRITKPVLIFKTSNPSLENIKPNEQPSIDTRQTVVTTVIENSFDDTIGSSEAEYDGEATVGSMARRNLPTQ